MPQKRSRPYPTGLLKKNAYIIGKLQQLADATLIAGLLFLLSRGFGIPFDANYILLAVITFFITPSLFKIAGLYMSHRNEHPVAEVPRLILGWGMVISILLLWGYLTKTSQIFSRALLFTWAVLTPLTLCCFHVQVRQLLRHWRASGNNSRTAVIAGAGELAGTLAQQIHQTRELGIHLRGFFTECSHPRLGLDDSRHRPLIGTLDELPSYVCRHGIDVVYIALSMQDEAAVAQLIDALQDTTAHVYFVPNITMFNLMRSRTQEFNGIPLLTVWESPFSEMEYLAKRGLDIFISCLILGVLWPLMVGIALAVKLSSPGPVLFKQRRYGLNGQEITIYKFRTMRVMEDGTTIPQAKRQDPRVTSIGTLLRSTSIDELPQFINVLQGRMSIVGPRPHAIAHNEHFRKRIQGYMLRHTVKPGITGWAQINGLRGETETLEKMEQRVAYDLHYLRNWSLGLDLEIILRTILVLFERQNAY